MTFITLVFTWMSVILMFLSFFVKSWCQRILAEMYKLNYAAACCLYYLYLEARNAAKLRKHAMMQSLLSNLARFKTSHIFLSGGGGKNLQHHTKAIILYSSAIFSGSIDAAGSVTVFCGLFLPSVNEFYVCSLFVPTVFGCAWLRCTELQFGACKLIWCETGCACTCLTSQAETVHQAWQKQLSPNYCVEKYADNEEGSCTIAGFSFN